MNILRKMAQYRTPFPDPENIGARREAESHWRPEQRTSVYVGLGRVMKCIGSSEEFPADDLGYVHIPVSQQGDAYLVPGTLLQKCLEAEPDSKPLPPPRCSGRSWAEFLTR